MNYIYSSRILQCTHFRYESIKSSPIRNVMDYEFDFCIGCEREMWLDDKTYKLEKGCFVIRKPGQKVSSKGNFDCYMLTLDFSSNSPSQNYSRNKATIMQPVFESEIWGILPSVFKPSHYDDYERIFKEFLSINEIDINDNPKTLSLLNELLHLLISDAFLSLRPAQDNHNSVIDDVCTYIKKHYMENISLDDIAAIVHLNKNYLIRQFKKIYGVSPISYLIKVRMDNAKKLLAKSDLPIKTVAELCGYNDPSFFNSYFKKTFYLTPAQFRRSQQADSIL